MVSKKNQSTTHILELQLIPDDQIIRQKRGILIRIDGKKEGFLHKEPIVIPLHNSTTLQLKLDRLSGSPSVPIDRSLSIQVGLNPRLKSLTILTASTLFFIATGSAFAPGLMINTVSITLVGVLSLLILASFTLWRNKWITLKITEI